ncbi:MAG TPA: hypothetical protein PKC24_12040 [Cyclobacteriaceae bacterium]|nr:hypothetical protein [Cyclobacteriaceae bacterium]
MHAQKAQPSIPLEYFYADPLKNNFRNFLSKFHFSLSTGYGQTFYRHQFEGLGIVQENGFAPALFIPGVGTTVQYSNWFNDIQLQSPLLSPDFTVISDTASIGFSSRGFNVPLKFSVHFEFDALRIGGGLSTEYMRINEFRPINYSDDIANLDPGINGAMASRYFLMAGLSFFRYYEYNFTAELNAGIIRLGGRFDPAVVQRNPYVNLGLTIEREMSEYFRIFVRPSVEWKTFTTSIPETNVSIRHTYPSAFLNFGVLLRINELKRCFISSCHAQVDHRHGNLTVRSRMHPIYKKQNPHYGENYPRLIRYKWKNRNKLNPY